VPMKEQRIQSIAVEVPFGESALVIFWLECRETESGIRISLNKRWIAGQETRDRVPLPPNTIVFVFIA